MSGKAREILWPKEEENIVLRTIFLHVGQGACTILIYSNAGEYDVALHDINLDEKNEGVDVIALMEDLLDGGSLDIFINSHPHNDHLNGLKELSESIAINEIWHSGHIPGKNHKDAYKILESAIKKVQKAGGKIIELEGSKEKQTLGDCEFYVLSPAEYVSDEIEGEDPETRYNRIHEQCVVIRIGANDTWILLPGDADRDAWEKHITSYHKKRLSAKVFAAPHHGSRSFFKHDEDDEPYLDALEAIDPEFVVIQAPRAEESEHDHPHDDALNLYEKQIEDKDNIYHTGADRKCFIFDIYNDGTLEQWDDNGELAKEYKLGDDKSGGFTKRKESTKAKPSKWA